MAGLLLHELLPDDPERCIFFSDEGLRLERPKLLSFSLASVTGSEPFPAFSLRKAVSKLHSKTFESIYSRTSYPFDLVVSLVPLLVGRVASNLLSCILGELVHG